MNDGGSHINVGRLKKWGAPRLAGSARRGTGYCFSHFGSCDTAIPCLATAARHGASLVYLSTAIATAFPPPRHSAAIPRFTSRRIIS